jgi:hypothetical protein
MGKMCTYFTYFTREVCSVRICKRCKEIFAPMRPYHQLCWPCWHAEQTAGEDEAAWHAGYQTGYRQGVLDGQRAGELPEPIFKGLLRLTHPDMHSGTTLGPLAHEVTVWLLNHRPDAAVAPRN